MGILYIVATPIGNLQDITIRAIKTLTSVHYIACEDTRTTGILLNEMKKILGKNYHDIDETGREPRLLSYYEQIELRRIPEIISILLNGGDVALVSDSGTPTISDPGYKLVREAIHHGIKVESIPGPSAVVSSLVASGLPTDKFLFLGFLPKKQGHRKKLLQNTIESSKLVPATIIFYEAPHRIAGILTELMELIGDREVVLARELTKIHEEYIRGQISTVLSSFEKKAPRGEFVVLFSLNPRL
jgi:16S rRNA (cytidine1402-2'-O)-methyltransferase